MDKRPIGFFDSGLGGASVLREALKLLPDENYVFFGDNGNAPYGDRQPDDIKRLSFAAVDRLTAMGVKAIVIACNTATAAAVEALRAERDIPIIGIEPAIKPACEQPGSGKVLMLATAATTRFPRYQALKARMPDPARVIDVPCPGFVQRIEKGIMADDAYDDLLEQHLGAYKGIQVDGIVLGCTHYPFIQGAILRYARANFTGPCNVFNGAFGCVRQLKRVIEADGLINGSGSADVEFHTSGDREFLEPIFTMLLRS